jgi:hypothetical protein
MLMGFGFTAKAQRPGRGAKEDRRGFWMKRNAEGSEDAEEDAEEEFWRDW